MSKESKPLTYQARAAVRSLAHAAYSLGCLALGDARGAAAYGAAGGAWGTLAVYVSGLVKLGTPQWLMDSLWVEPPPIDSIDPADDKVPDTHTFVYGEAFLDERGN